MGWREDWKKVLEAKQGSAHSDDSKLFDERFLKEFEEFLDRIKSESVPEPDWTEFHVGDKIFWVTMTNPLDWFPGLVSARVWDAQYDAPDSNLAQDLESSAHAAIKHVFPYVDRADIVKQGVMTEINYNDSYPECVPLFIIKISDNGSTFFASTLKK